jgi:hypothetical protein
MPLVGTIISTEDPRPDDAGRILPLAHNWSAAYRYSIEFKTDIITSANGKEQRRAVRNRARHFAEMQATLNGRKRLNWDILKTGWQPASVFAGIEMLSVRTRAYMAPEALSVSIVPGDHFWFTEGQRVVLVRADNSAIRETRTIDSVSSGSMTFKENSLGEFPVGSRIMLAAACVPEEEDALSLLTNRVSTASIKINYRPLGGPGNLPNVGSPYYEGAWEVFHWKPQWANGNQVRYVWPRDVIDYGYGQWRVWNHIEFPARIYKFDFIGKTLRETLEVAAFFQRVKGMRTEFLMPTWEDDVPFSSLAGGGMSIIVPSKAFGVAYRDSSVFKRIMLRYPDGTVSYHKVDYIETLPDTESSVVRVTEPLPVTELTPQTVVGISWLLVARFAIDRMDMDFLTNDVAQYSLTMQTLENFEL